MVLFWFSYGFLHTIDLEESSSKGAGALADSFCPVFCRFSLSSLHRCSTVFLFVFVAACGLRAAQFSIGFLLVFHWLSGKVEKET